MTTSISPHHDRTVIAKLQHGLYLFGLFCLSASAFLVPLSLTGTSICMFVAAACSVLSGQFFRQFHAVKTNPLVICILLIFFFAVISMFWSIAPWAERLSALHKYDKLLYFVFLIPLCIQEKWRDRAVNAFLLAMVLTVAISYLKQYAGFMFGLHPTDAAWIFNSHIETSYFVAFSAYIFIYRAVYEERFKWFYVALFLLFSWQEFFINDGRTGWLIYLSLVVLFSVQIMLKKNIEVNISAKDHVRSIVKGVFVGGVVSILLAVSFYMFSEQVQNAMGYWVQKYVYGEEIAADNYQESLEQRLDFVHASLVIVRENPVLGVGPGGFPDEFERINGLPDWGHPHNEYLLTLVHFGPIGLLLFLYFFYMQWKMTFKNMVDWPIAQAFLFSFMLGACYNAFLYTSVTGRFYVIFLALYFSTNLSKGKKC